MTGEQEPRQPELTPQTPQTPPRVSVLVVTYGNGDEIDRCLDGVLRQDDGRQSIEIIVVDNASADDTADRVSAYGDKVRLVRNAVNVGFAAGVNQAARLATGDFLLLLNPDCEMDSGCVTALWHALATRPGLGLAAALLRDPDGGVQEFPRRGLTSIDRLFTLTDVGVRIDRRFRGSRAMRQRRYSDELARIDASDDPLVVDCAAAACVMLWSVHGTPAVFDERLPLFFNDAELAWRLSRKGYRSEVIPAAGAVHGYGTTHRRLPRARRRAEFVASLREYVRRTGTIRASGCLWGVLLLDTVSSAVLMLPVGSDQRRREAFANLRGVLGGLGVPKLGARPVLIRIASPPSRAKAALKRAVRTTRPALRSGARRIRRRRFLVRLRLGAWIVGSHVDVRVDPTADIASDVRVAIRPHTRVAVDIGPNAEIQPGTVLRLDGRLEVGPYSQIRYGATVNIHGVLRLEGRNVVGHRASVHADEVMVWEWGASIAEYASVIDSDHLVDGSVVQLLDHPVAAAPIRLGGGAFVAAHSTVLPGVTIGAGTAVGANSVVSRSLPAGVVAVGAPAVPKRALPRGWQPVAPPA